MSAALKIEYPLAYNPILDYWAQIENGNVIVGDKVRRIYRKLAADVYDQQSEYYYSPNHANHAIEFNVVNHHHNLPFIFATTNRQQRIIMSKGGDLDVSQRYDT